MSDAARIICLKKVRQKGFFDFIEKFDNFLPDPIMILVWLIGLIKNTRDVIDRMIDGIRSMEPYIVFALFAAHFVAMFNWSRLGPIAAINGAEILQSVSLPAPGLLVSVLLFSSFLDLFIGSASAKWTALVPVVVPMFMLLGISP
jgi:aminobenzoyl-glutamate transport protein